MKDRVFEARVQPGGWTSVSPLPTPDELREFYSALYYQAPQSTTYQSTYSELDLRYKQLKCDALLHALSAREKGEGEGKASRAPAAPARPGGRELAVLGPRCRRW